MLGVLDWNLPVALNPEDDFWVTQQVTALDAVMGHAESLPRDFFDCQRVESGHVNAVALVYLHLGDRLDTVSGENLSNCLDLSLPRLIPLSVKRLTPSDWVSLVKTAMGSGGFEPNADVLAHSASLRCASCDCKGSNPTHPLRVFSSLRSSKMLMGSGGFEPRGLRSARPLGVKS